MGRTLTIKQTAETLGVSRTKVWAMVRAGELEAVQDPIDKRQRLVSAESVQELLDRRGQPKRKLPRTIGMVSDGTIQSRDAKGWIRSHWRLDD
jgi:excisionase family DNA binding protein